MRCSFQVAGPGWGVGSILILSAHHEATKIEKMAMHMIQNQNPIPERFAASALSQPSTNGLLSSPVSGVHREEGGVRATCCGTMDSPLDERRAACPLRESATSPTQQTPFMTQTPNLPMK